MATNPYFTSASITNHIDDSNLSTQFFEDGGQWFYYGCTQNYKFYLSTTLSSLYRKNYYTNEPADSISGFFDPDEFFLYNYIPIDEDHGIILLEKYNPSTGEQLGDLYIYDIDWVAGTSAFRNTYHYDPVFWGGESEDKFYYLDNVVEVVLYNGDIRLIMNIYKEGYSLIAFDFLLYNYTENVFTLLPTSEDSEDELSINYKTDMGHVADLGNGYACIVLSCDGDLADPAFMGNLYVALVNTNNKSVSYVLIPKNISDPATEGDYFYAVTYVAPYRVDHSAYLLTVYDEYDGVEFLQYYRVLKCSYDGTLTTILTKDYGYYDLSSDNNLLYSKNSVWGSQYITPYMFFYNLTSSGSFSVGHYSHTALSRTLDEGDDSIVALEYKNASTLSNQYVSSSAVWYEENDCRLYQNGWDWTGWNVESPSVRYETNYVYGRRYTGTYTNLTATGIVISASSGYFADYDNLPVGDLIWSDTLQSNPQEINYITGTANCQRYMITSTGHYISGYDESNPIYCTMFAAFRNDTIGNNNGKRGVDLDSATLVVTDPITGSSVLTNYKTDYRASSDGNHAEVFGYFYDGSTANTWTINGASVSTFTLPNILTVSTGEDDWLTGDDEGSLGIEVYESPRETLELSASTQIQGFAYTGCRIIPTVRCFGFQLNYVVSSYNQLKYFSTDGCRPFMRIYFTDSTFIEQNYWGSYTITASDHGKEYDHVTLGVYFGDSYRQGGKDRYALKMVITSLIVETHIDTHYALKKISLADGTERTLVDVDALAGVPTLSGTVRYLRLVGDSIIYPYSYYNNTYLIMHYNAEPTSVGNLFQLIWWFGGGD